MLSTAVLSVCGCRQDMHNQPKYIPLRSSDFFPDGRSSRLPVEGAVARGQLKEDTYFYTGKVGAVDGDKLPFPLTEEILIRGHERFNIYCTPCHSRVGDGNGMVVQRGFRRAGNLHDPKLLSAHIGHFFDVITNGFGAMPDYSAQITPQDRWAIAAYIRVLQFSDNATLADVPADMQGKIKTLAEVQAEQEGADSGGATPQYSNQGAQQREPNKDEQPSQEVSPTPTPEGPAEAAPVQPDPTPVQSSAVSKGTPESSLDGQIPSKTAMREGKRQGSPNVHAAQGAHGQSETQGASKH